MKSTNVRENNKGFSLVELIVVIAIMAILAVTLAPRLAHYVEKARTASDREVVNSIYTAAKLAYFEDQAGYATAAADDTGATTGDPASILQLRQIVTSGSVTLNTTLYNVAADAPSSGKWTISTGIGCYQSTNKYVNELRKILSSFELKSKNVGAGTQITITITDDKVKVVLDYNGDGIETADTDIIASEQ